MEHLSLKDTAYKYIREKLLNYNYEPGGRIREDMLAEELSMSRTPVREAINRLTKEGLVVNVPRKGLFFVELTQDDVEDLLFVREGLEVMAVQKCIEVITHEQIIQFEHILLDFEKALIDQNFHEYSRLDALFHKTIAKITKNEKLIDFIEEIEDFIRIARAMETPDFSSKRRERSVQQHRNIIDCIKKRDKSGAASAISANIQSMEDKIMD